MNRATKAGLLGLGLIVALPSAAVAPTVEKFKTDRQELQAQFETTDASGCIVTRVVVLAGEFVTRTKPNGSTSSSRVASYNISRFDTCNGVDLVFRPCHSEAFSMTISRDLQNAHLSDSAVFCFDEVRNIGVYIDVNVTFQATEPADRHKIRSSFTAPGFHFTFQVTGVIAEGVASGAIVENSTNYTSAPSFLAITSTDAISESSFTHVH